jgi:hypothetical protein
MGLRIGLVGAPCTGKTTLAKAVAEKLNLTFIGESFEGAQKQCEIHGWKITTEGRNWPDYFDSCWADTKDCTQDIINFTKGIAWDLDAKELFVSDNFITDSASPSCAAAGLIYNTFLEYTDPLMTWYNEQLERAKNYTHLFFIPVNPDIAMVDDNRRPTNKALQKQFDLILPSLMICDLPEGILHYSITDSSLEDRINYVLRKVNQ